MNTILTAVFAMCITALAASAEPVIVDVNPTPVPVVRPTTPTVRPAVERPRVRWFRRFCR
jgi:hypothetical protein